MTVYSANHNGYLSACRPGLPHGGTWRCPELSMSGGMNPSNPVRPFEQAICMQIKKTHSPVGFIRNKVEFISLFVCLLALNSELVLNTKGK